MKRLFVCTPTHYLQGGVERILEALAGGLPAREWEVTFGLAKGAKFHDPDRFRGAFPSIHGVEIDGTSGTVYGRRTALRRAIVEADPDAVLIARMFDAYPVCAALKREGHRLRLGVTVQAHEPEYFTDLATYADFVDVCVTSGRLIADEAARVLPADRVISIPGGVATPLRYVTHRDGPLRLGYVGRLEERQKRALDLAQLAHKLRKRATPFTLDVAGDGGLMTELRGRMPYARFHGWLSRDELYEFIYPELDVLLHFAEWEGITIAPREAMAHGVVPVVSEFRGLVEEGQMIDDENALTFPVGDVSSAADAIDLLHIDRELLTQLSANARKSQTGIRSEQGALDAWAAAFEMALEREPRVGEILPPAPEDEGLLQRLGVPPHVAEKVRRLRRRKHDDPGAEWPHWSGLSR